MMPASATATPLSAVSALTGLVTYLTEVELRPGDPEIFVVAAQAADLSVLDPRNTTTANGSGAGLTWDDAAGAAVGECLERYAASTLGDEIIVGSHRSLRRRGCSAPDPAAWALFDDSQSLQAVYPMFTKDVPIAWTRGRSLATGADTWLPACLIYMVPSSVFTDDGVAVLGPAISTGCACASTWTEATLKGLCEIVERDAFMIVWRNRLAVCEVEIDEGSSLHQLFADRFARPGLEYHLWQTTLDLELPSFFGLLIDRRDGGARSVVGGAAHPDKDRAASKTLLELVQGLNWLDYLGRGTRDERELLDVRTFQDRAMLYGSRSLIGAFDFLRTSAPRVPFSELDGWTERGADAIDRLVELCARRVHDPAVIDLTTPDVQELGYVVTRAVVPGLETMEGDHRLQMLGGRRWRDVPVELGLAQRRLEIADVNPLPHPYP